jgi:hypothetical protein
LIAPERCRSGPQQNSLAFFFGHGPLLAERNTFQRKRVATATRTQVAIIGGEFVGFPAIFVLQ